MASQLPWEMLNAETLRSMCRDFGLHGVPGRRADMIARLQEVERDGLDAVQKRLQDLPPVPRVKRAKKAEAVEAQGEGEDASLGKRKSRLRKEPQKKAEHRSNEVFDGVILPPPQSRGRASSKASAEDIALPSSSKKRKAESTADADDEADAEPSTAGDEVMTS